ncbi:MAG TPA: hypothetical protein VFF60_11875 [Candidatus Binatus sp.]|nr:hypothetical protein [Candidatus Binatus sp.]
MARLNAGDVERFLERLKTPAPPADDTAQIQRSDAAEHTEQPALPADDDELVPFDDPRNDAAAAIAGALEQAVRSYLGRDVTIEVEPHAAPSAGSLRFESIAGADSWRAELDATVATAIADIAIGGDGENVRHAKRNRTGKQLEGFAHQMMCALASALRADAPSSARYSSDAQSARAGTEVDSGHAGGSLAIGDTRGAWYIGFARSQAHPVMERPVAVTQPLERVSSTRDVVLVAPEPAPRAQPRAPAPLIDQARARRSSDTDGDFEPAVEAATARLAETVRCTAELETLEVERVDTPVLTRGDLKLALIAGGQGSLVFSADKETVASVAAAAIGVDQSTGADAGPVCVDAVEAILRASMRAFAERLPAIAGTPPRFVRLADGALPARSPHFQIVAPVRIAERAATLRWLVPAWMAGSRKDGRAD